MTEEHEVDWTGHAAREAVYARQGGLCALCWLPCEIEVMEAHHRRKRATMPERALWCPCNVVGLHARCHTQGERHRWIQPMPLGSWAVHDHPEASLTRGLIVRDENPATVPIIIEWPWIGAALLDHNGDVVSTLW